MHEHLICNFKILRSQLSSCKTSGNSKAAMQLGRSCGQLVTLSLFPNNGLQAITRVATTLICYNRFSLASLLFGISISQYQFDTWQAPKWLPIPKNMYKYCQDSIFVLSFAELIKIEAFVCAFLGTQCSSRGAYPPTKCSKQPILLTKPKVEQPTHFPAPQTFRISRIN